MTTAYPLTWPVGWPRTVHRARATFAKTTPVAGQTWRSHAPLTVAQARTRLILELERLGAQELALSSNLQLNVDGTPRSNQAEPRDPGVAAYFKLKDRDRVLACDKWDRAADNIAAIAKHIEAIRGQARWGVGNLEQAFTGYTALPPPRSGTRYWGAVLREGLQPLERGSGWTRDLAEKAYRRLLLTAHPDRGGTNSAAAELNAAIVAAREELK